MHPQSCRQGYDAVADCNLLHWPRVGVQPSGGQFIGPVPPFRKAALLSCGPMIIY